jgi:hypothetical protein
MSSYPDAKISCRFLHHGFSQETTHHRCLKNRFAFKTILFINAYFRQKFELFFQFFSLAIHWLFSSNDFRHITSGLCLIVPQVNFNRVIVAKTFVPFFFSLFYNQFLAISKKCIFISFCNWLVFNLSWAYEWTVIFLIAYHRLIYITRLFAKVIFWAPQLSISILTEISILLWLFTSLSFLSYFTACLKSWYYWFKNSYYEILCCSYSLKMSISLQAEKIEV